MTRRAPLLRDVAVGAAIGLLTWPVLSLAPWGIGLDASWSIALHLAARMSLSYGTDIVFTFGPLGFLGYPQPYLAWTSAAALVFTGAVHITVCALMYHVARQALGGPIAGVLVFGSALAISSIAAWPVCLMLLFTVAVSAVTRRPSRPSDLPFAVGLGIAVGIAGLGQVQVGVVSAAIAGVAVVATARAWPRSLAGFLGSAALVLVLLWLSAGEHLTDLAAYVRGIVEIGLGYSSSMALGDPRSAWESGVILLITLVTAGFVWQRFRALTRRDRIAIAILFGILLFGEAKADFIRDRFDAFLATLLILWPLVIPPTRSWVGAGAPVAGMLAAFLAVAQAPLATLIDPVGHVGAAVQEVVTVATARTEAAASTAAMLRATYDLPPDALALLAGRTVHIEPWDAAVADAYPEVHWDPLPVFQAYSAYTPYLDGLNADRLASEAAPDRILWLTPDDAPLSIDGRSVWFDSPEAKVQMLCRYSLLASAPGWQVLTRTADRCASPITVATLTTTAGAVVAVPQDLPPGIVTVSVSGVAQDLVSQVETGLYRSPIWWLTNGSARARMVISTADEPNILGAQPDDGWAGQLHLTKPQSTITIAPEAGTPGLGSALTVVFQVIPVTASP